MIEGLFNEYLSMKLRNLGHSFSRLWWVKVGLCVAMFNHWWEHPDRPGDLVVPKEECYTMKSFQREQGWVLAQWVSVTSCPWWRDDVRLVERKNFLCCYGNCVGKVLYDDMEPILLFFCCCANEHFVFNSRFCTTSCFSYTSGANVGLRCDA